MAPVVRGCGTRVVGGVYVETLLGPNGHPIECMIKDPALPIDAESMGLTPVGVKLIEHAGVVHIFDWVGESYYPNVSDFIEEVRRFGASRRLSSTLDFSLLTPESRLILLHSKAVVPAFESEMQSPQLCPRMMKALHDRRQSSIDEHVCARQWWTDHDAKRRLLPGEEFEREMPSFSYTVRQQPAPYVPPATIGIFMVLPISQIAVVRDPSNNTHEKVLTALGSKLHDQMALNLVDE